MNFVQIEKSTGAIMTYMSDMESAPTPTHDNWEVHEVLTSPIEETRFINGMEFDVETNSLVHTLESMNVVNLEYLNQTDWYVVRSIETGKSIPAEVTTKRAEARASIV